MWGNNSLGILSVLFWYLLGHLKCVMLKSVLDLVCFRKF